MRLFEFTDAPSQMGFWDPVTDSVWREIAKQEHEQKHKQIDAEHAKSAKAVPMPPNPYKPRILSTKTTKVKKKAPQEIEPGKIQAKKFNSVRKPTFLPGSSETQLTNTCLSNRVSLDPNSVANVQRKLDPLPFDPIVKRLTN